MQQRTFGAVVVLVVSMMMMVSLFLVVDPRTAHAAEPTKAACAEAYEAGQRLQKTGALRAAAEKYIVCGNGVCPATLQRDCVTWFAEVERTIPTIVIAAHRADGKNTEIVDAVVKIDDAVRSNRFDGRELPLDPGEHIIEVQTPDGVKARQTVVARLGERHRIVTFEIASSSPTSPTESGTVDGTHQQSQKREASSSSAPLHPTQRPVPWLVYPLGVLSLAGFAGFAGFGIAGESQLEKLDDRGCKPQCNRDDVVSAQRSFLIADVSLLVGVGAVVAGVVVYLFRPEVLDSRARADSRGAAWAASR